jgi:hypothetical protein
LWLAILVLATPACSLILDFDTPLADSGPPPPDGGPDAAPRIDGGMDPYEPNDSASEATVIMPGTTAGPSISPAGDHDFYRFTLTETRDVTIDCNFIPTEGDLEMELLDGTLVVIDRSTNFSMDEQIVRSGAEALPMGDYFIRIFGFNDDFTNSYEIVLTVL